MTAWILDLIAAAVIVFAVRKGAREGLLRALWRFAAWALTIALMFVLSKPAIQFLSSTKLSEDMNNAVHDMIDQRFENINISDNNEDISSLVSDALGVPVTIAPYILSDTRINNALDGVSDALANTVSDFLIRIIADIFLIILIRLALMLIFHIISFASKLPVLKQANKFLGGTLGFVNAMLIIYLILAVMYLLLPLNIQAYDLIKGTVLVKYLYNNNILLQLFMEI